jgi:hypothetical protein
MYGVTNHCGKLCDVSVLNNRTRAGLKKIIIKSIEYWQFTQFPSKVGQSFILARLSTTSQQGFPAANIFSQIISWIFTNQDLFKDLQHQTCF